MHAPGRAPIVSVIACVDLTSDIMMMMMMMMMMMYVVCPPPRSPRGHHHQPHRPLAHQYDRR